MLQDRRRLTLFDYKADHETHDTSLVRQRPADTQSPRYSVPQEQTALEYMAIVASRHITVPRTYNSRASGPVHLSLQQQRGGDPNSRGKEFVDATLHGGHCINEGSTDKVMARQGTVRSHELHAPCPWQSSIKYRRAAAKKQRDISKTIHSTGCRASSFRLMVRG
jgi:hypothetical protein